LLDLLILKPIVLQNLPWLCQKQDCQKYLMHLQEDYWTLGPIFDCKQQRLMYILQNQNDCPRLDHLQLNCNLYRRNKETQHTPLLEFS
jgi:hypothetical protein